MQIDFYSEKFLFIFHYKFSPRQDRNILNTLSSALGLQPPGLRLGGTQARISSGPCVRSAMQRQVQCLPSPAEAPELSLWSVLTISVYAIYQGNGLLKKKKC